MEDEEINISFDNIINLIDESKYSEEIINSLEKKKFLLKKKYFHIFWTIKQIFLYWAY